MRMASERLQIPRGQAGLVRLISVYVVSLGDAKRSRSVFEAAT